MRGTQVAEWSELPPEQDRLLKAISLHGLEDNFELLDAMSFDELQACVPQVVEAARGCIYIKSDSGTEHGSIRRLR